MGSKVWRHNWEKFIGGTSQTSKEVAGVEGGKEARRSSDEVVRGGGGGGGAGAGANEGEEGDEGDEGEEGEEGEEGDIVILKGAQSGESEDSCDAQPPNIKALAPLSAICSMSCLQIGRDEDTNAAGEDIVEMDAEGVW